jgi:hypothetical protein
MINGALDFYPPILQNLTLLLDMFEDFERSNFLSLADS